MIDDGLWAIALCGGFCPGFPLQVLTAALQRLRAFRFNPAARWR